MQKSIRPTNRKFTVPLMLVTILPLLFACLFGSPDPNLVHIRIKNDSTRTIGQAVLGSGQQNGETNGYFQGRFAKTLPGETSRYHSLEPIEANYNFIEIRFDSGEKRVTQWLNKGRTAPIGAEEFEPGGFYTLEFDFIDNKAIVNIEVDQAP